MSRAIITVTELQSPGRFSVERGSGPRRFRTDISGPAAAAAKAMQYAQRGGAYQIFAPQKVLDFIPEDMRGKK